SLRASEDVGDACMRRDRMELFVNGLVRESLDVARCRAVIGQRREPVPQALERERSFARLIDASRGFLEPLDGLLEVLSEGHGSLLRLAVRGWEGRTGMLSVVPIVQRVTRARRRSRPRGCRPRGMRPRPS